ncbi:hypothetical protein TNCT_607171 [Trichonephila clavata]|uniref:Uncharacterized protein n=1 Tax=Trichonephila clavata TaxID=2740835 RepID=A0A8X6KDE7_TRICU|nr:hypothetical protein TNCT_607171 [Trichonephila clavata]
MSIENDCLVMTDEEVGVDLPLPQTTQSSERTTCDIVASASEVAAQSNDFESSIEKTSPGEIQAPACGAGTDESSSNNPEQPLIPPEPQITGGWERFRRFAKKAKFYFMILIQTLLLAIFILGVYMGIKYRHQCHSNLTYEIVVIWSFSGVIGFCFRALSICLALLSEFPAYRVLRDLAYINALAVILMISVGTCFFFTVEDLSLCSEFLYYALYLDIAACVIILLAFLVQLIEWCYLCYQPDPRIDVQRQQLLS